MPYRLFPRRLRDRVGRRGLVLLLFGISWVVQGAAFFLLADLFAGQPELFLIDKLPLPVQGGLWIACGVLSISAALRPRREDDTFGFNAVSLMPMALAASYLIGTVDYARKDDQLLATLGALGFLAWGPITLALTIVAGWYEPPITGGDE